VGSRVLVFHPTGTQRAPNGHPTGTITNLFRPSCASSRAACQRHNTQTSSRPPVGKVKLPTRPCAHATGRTRTVSFPSRGFVNCKPKVVASGFRYRVRSTVAMPEELPLALPGR
jgi:hypothetical protein